MAVIAAADVKKDARNRVTLFPNGPTFDHYHMTQHDDGHIELHPRVLTTPVISVRTLAMMDESMASLDAGLVGDPVDPEALLKLLGEE